MNEHTSLRNAGALYNARLLSAGTMSYLIRRNDYTTIDLARANFVAFIERMDELSGNPLYASWQEAWQAFRSTGKFHELTLGTHCK